jgi:hypothetical protein
MVNITGKEPKGTFTITAKTAEGTGTSISETTSTFSFEADFSGKSTLQTASAHDNTQSIAKSNSVKSLPETLDMKLRAGESLMFCAKTLSTCANADWTPLPCSTGCTISGTTVSYTTKKMGTYVLVGPYAGAPTPASPGGGGGGGGVVGSPNSNSTSSDASAPSTSFNLVLYLAATALALLCF